MTKPLDRHPVRAIPLLLAGAAVYIYVLLLAVGYQAQIPQPGLLARLVSDQKARFWTWDQCTHLLMVLAISAPFAWLLTRLFGRRLVLAAAVVVTPTVIWLVLDYFSIRAELPDAPPLLDLFYGLDTLEVALILPLLAWLLRPARS
jgi:hypothetical protein